MSWKIHMDFHDHIDEEEAFAGCTVLTCNTCGAPSWCDEGVPAHWDSDQKADAISIACDSSCTDEPWYSPDEDHAYCFECRKSCEHEHDRDEDGWCWICFTGDGS